MSQTYDKYFEKITTVTLDSENPQMSPDYIHT